MAWLRGGGEGSKCKKGDPRVTHLLHEPYSVEDYAVIPGLLKPVRTVITLQVQCRAQA